ncbi:hypothetical protein PL81_37330 [Streptomyces sp. RSD-27]|nr:hypothetical protein PL81_37330 [Streptomyces sp. RSD-27]
MKGQGQHGLVQGVRSGQGGERADGDADCGVDDDHQGDDHGVGVVPDGDGEQGGAEQRHDERVAQLRQDPAVQRCGAGDGTS